jgi:tetratricopeptide (TPR) repeat protein
MSALRLFLVGVLALALSGLATADPVEDADTQAARRHFERGRALYDTGAYEEACQEFRESRRVLDLPAFDFNLAKCEEHLEHWQVAIEGYERFLSRAPNDENAPEVRRRVAVLRARTASIAPAPTERDRKAGEKRHELRLAAIGVAVATGALAAGGFGAYYSTWDSYSTQKNECTNVMRCMPSDYAQLSSRVEHAEIAAGVVGGLAGVAAISDIALWALSARRPSMVHASLPAHIGSGAQF